MRQEYVRTRLTRVMFATAVLGGAVVVGGAAGASRVGSRASSHALTTVHVGTLPIVDDAPIYVGMKEGFFARAGIKVVPVAAENGSAIVPAVLAGSEQFGFSNNTSLIVASSKGLPVTIISGALTSGGSTKSGYSELVVKASSPIKTLADLKGATIAVNALGNVGPLTVNYALQKAGVNPASVRYVVIPFPSMNSALQKGQVQVIWDIEPFLALFRAEKYPIRVLANTMTTVSPNFPVSSYFTSASYLASHRQTVVAFARALRESLAFSESHLNVVASVLPTYTAITGHLAHFLVYPTFTSNPEVAVLHKTAQLAVSYHFTTSAPRWGELLSGLGKG